MTTLNTVVSVTATEDTAYTYTYASLKLKATDESTDTVAFKITGITSGTLQYGASKLTLDPTQSVLFSTSGISINGGAFVTGSLYWTPPLNANGSINGFTIKASSSTTVATALSATDVPVSFNVTAVNDAPIINSISNMLDAVAGTAKTFLGSDLITHISATDVEGSALSYKITAVSNGTLTVNGSAVSTPYTILSTDSFSWTATTAGTIAGFSIVANDGLLDFVTPTVVNFVVSTPPNSLPQLVGATPSTTILETQTTTPFSSMIIADADSGQTVGATITLSAANGTLSGSGLTVDATNGYLLSAVSPTALTTAIKALVFTPTIVAADGVGTKTTTFTVTATDSFAYGAGTVTNSQTVVAVTTLNDAPTSSGLSVTTFEDTSKTFTVSDFNYVDAESVSLETVQLFSLPTAGTLKYNNVSATLNQEILSANLGLLTFTPALNANGDNYATFQYKVSDGVFYSSAATATINVTAVNDAPVGVNDVNSAVKTLTMTGNVLTNDTDIDVGATKTVSAVGSTAVSSSPVSFAGTYGNLTINADGSYSYLADATKAVVIALKSNMSPLTDTFTYTVSDGALTSTAHLTLTIQGSANNVPVATATAIAMGEDANVAATGTLSANDADGDTLLIKAHVDSSLTFTSDTAITTPLALVGTYGTLTLNSDKTYSYALDITKTQALAQGETTTDSFAYQVDDSRGGYATALIGVTITGANDAPVAVADSLIATEEDTPKIYTAASLLGNDTDVDTAHSALSIQSVANGTGGTVVLNSDGTVTFTPTLNFNGAATFTYITTDGLADSSGATASLTVNTVNNAPIFTKGADQTSFEDAGAQTVTGFATDISAGATNEATQTLTFNVTNTNNAAFSDQPAISPTTGNLTYTFASNFNGAVTVNATLSDDGGTADGGVDISAAQSFTITSTPVVDAALVISGATTTLEDTQSGLIQIARNAVDGAEVTYFQITGISANGSLYQADGSTAIANNAYITAAQATDGLRFTPTANYNAASGTIFNVKGSLNGSSVGGEAVTPILMTVTPVNDAPTFTVAAHEITITSAVSPQALTEIAVSEVDGEAVTATVDVIAGTLSATAATNLTITGNATSTLTLRGLASIVNTALTTLKYTQAGNSDDSLTVSVQDFASPNLKADNQVVSLIIDGNDSYPNTPGGFDFSANSSISYPSEPLFVSNYGATAVGVSQTVSPAAIVFTANSHTLTLTSCPTVLDGSKVQFSNGSKLLVNTGSATSLYGGYNANGDQLVAGSAGDILFGYDGDDLLIGGAGLDKFYAGNGNDTVVGNSGNDIIVGGAGNDYFVYHTASGSSEGTDVILDFVKNADKIALTADNTINTTSTPAATGFTITTSGGNTTITLTGTTTTILLNGVIGVTASDFVLV